MLINSANNRSNVTFGYKVFVDSGASDPKRGSFKVSICSEQTGDEFFSTKQLPEKYKKVGPEGGFNSSDDYIKGLSSRISKAIELAKDKIATLKGDDKLLSGVLINAPGYVVGGTKAPFIPNLIANNGENLKDVDFTKIDVKARKNPAHYRLIATNDMHGAAVGVAKELKKSGMLEEGFHGLICMTGGGMGVVNIKVKDGNLEIEGSETGHNRIVAPGKAKSLERGAASVSALITNYSDKMGYDQDKTFSLVTAGNAKLVTEAFVSGTKDEQKAAAFAIRKYIDALSQEFARKVTEGVNTIILSGPLALGIKAALAEKTGNAQELKDQLMKKVHKHLPPTGPGLIMADIHNFSIVTDMEIPDNTVGGGILLDSAKFIGKKLRGNWINIPINSIK